MNNTNPKNSNINSYTELHKLLEEGLIAIKNEEYNSMEEVFKQIKKKFEL